MFDNGLFLLQIAIIIAVSRLVASVFRRFGQPEVVGEMAAGVFLGPSLFGLLAPAAFHALFPAASLGFLNSLSQAGLVMFMFLVGVRVDFDELRRQTGIAIVISNISVLVPLLMGIGLAQYLYPRYGNNDPVAFALFIGTAMSITAFPVLARILVERNLMSTHVGSVAIACAAVGDITAWILLATLVTVAKHDPGARPLWGTLIYLTVYLAILLVVRSVLHAWAKRIDATALPLNAMMVCVAIALISGAAGEWIGIHALVGAFAAGLITPRQFRSHLIEKLEAVTVVLLIPLFFALTGIRTNLLFGSGGGFYLDLLLIVFVAIASKWGGTMLGAHVKGMPWRDACRLGLMMNTRGLVELIVLNVGLENGILSPPLFSMMVCMALITTLMTMPLIDLFARTDRRAISSGRKFT